MSEHPIQGLIDTAMNKIKEMIDGNTIIGEPIPVGKGGVIIPVSKVSLGFASGGSDFPTKTPKQVFGGASGAGLSVSPVGFLVVNGDDVRLLEFTKKSDTTADRLVNMVPGLSLIHIWMVYVQLKEGADFAAVKAAVLADPYFVHDETHVAQVEDVKALIDTGHGVNLVRKGVSGTTHNQNFEFNMSINNPALTAQVLVCAARAACKRAPGAYTMIDLPVIDLLPGDRGSLIRALV